jgi:hypothetical protein
MVATVECAATQYSQPFDAHRGDELPRSPSVQWPNVGSVSRTATGDDREGSANVYRFERLENGCTAVGAESMVDAVVGNSPVD